MLVYLSIIMKKYSYVNFNYGKAAISTADQISENQIFRLNFLYKSTENLKYVIESLLNCN